MLGYSVYMPHQCGYMNVLSLAKTKSDRAYVNRKEFVANISACEVVLQKVQPGGLSIQLQHTYTVGTHH